MLLTPERCFFSRCTDFAEHTHHITYNPEVTKPLCRRHHEEITILNGQQARKVRHELSNKYRWWIWFQWLEGKLKPRRTRKALEYVEEWDKGTATQVESRLTTVELAEQYRREQAEVFTELDTLKKRERSRKKTANAAKSGRLGAIHQFKVSMRLEGRKKKKNKQKDAR